MEATNNEMSMIRKTALELLDFVKAKIVNNECSDDDITDAMAKFHPSVNKDYYNPKDYCTYDEACKELGIPVTSRVKLRKLCDDYGIECVYIKNRPLGFPKKDIKRLAEVLKEEQIKKQAKRKKHL